MSFPELRETSPLPERADRDAVDAWLVAAHQRAWVSQLHPQPTSQAG